MVQFNQAPIIEEGIDSIVSEQEKKERIRKALEIHMLDNREKHLAREEKTLFSFTQGDPNAVIGKAHGFGEAMEEKKTASIEQQRMEQQQQQWPSAGHKTQAAPVRTCPCCVQFLQNTFHMSDKQANEFIGGATGGPVGYGSNTASESYGAGGASGEYSGSSSSGEYNSSSGGSYKPNDEDSNYFGNKGGYMP